jgi:membrane-associated protease RseP (regulator of RpoE activity)
MVSFWVYDVSFLVLFSLFVVWFLSSRKKALNRQGIIFMYRTQFGVKLIRYVGDNFKRMLLRLRYVIVGIGLVLMGVMIWMLGQTVAIYLLYPEITKVIKAPPIAPLIPYFPRLFGMRSFFPPFYFTYFIVALAIVAIVHEFSHGIFMRLFKVRIKSTGLVFLGPILGAFVEEEKKGFEKKKKLEQMTVLGAGVFANLIFALIFYGLYVAFFFSSFTASGYVFDSYGLAVVPLDVIDGFGEYNNLTTVITANGTFYLDDDLAIQLTEGDGEYLVAYGEAPAVLAQMRGAIVMADDVAIKNRDDLRWFLESKEPGDEVVFVTEVLDDSDEPDVDGVESYDIVLGEHPLDSSAAYLGVGNSVGGRPGFVRDVLGKFMGFKESSTYYKPIWDGDFVYFVYHLLWWVMVINLLVALFNMLPLGMLDGGRFFYLTVLSVTGSNRVAKWAYRVAGYAILFVFLLLMFFWFIRIV